ncbi:MAG TPA: Ppx/GppA phosphatase family protein [Actinomycetota bacterium]|nr:Ppx/GppA phosphatase family protein [Actinomycetota bacterium]
MRVAAIDTGTNSTRLLVAEDVVGGFRTLERRMVITRLGEGVDRRRSLSPEALKRTLATIADYAAVCGEYGVERLRVTGTSAVRDARNKNEFFEGVERLTGKVPELLSGDTEARTTFLGVRGDLGDPQNLLVVDIGGGSTELIYGAEEPEALVSLDVGCVRMFEKYLESDPPTTDEIDALRAEVLEGLQDFAESTTIERGTRLVGVAGTVSQLARLKSGSIIYDPEITHHLVMSHGDVRLLTKRLLSLPFERRKRISGLEPGRADVIVAGAIILLCVMEAFDFAEVTASEKDILDGLVLELIGD